MKTKPLKKVSGLASAPLLARSLVAIVVAVTATACMSTNKMQDDAFPTLEASSNKIREDFTAQQGTLKACWMPQRKVFRNRVVKVEVKVGIIGEGKVKDVSIPKVSVKNVAFETCLKNKVKEFAFRDVFVPTDLETKMTFPLQIGTSVKQ